MIKWFPFHNQSFFYCVCQWIREFNKMEINLIWIYFIDPRVRQSSRIFSPVCQTFPPDVMLDSIRAGVQPNTHKHCRAAPRGCAYVGYVVLRALSKCTNNTLLWIPWRPSLSVCLGLASLRTLVADTGGKSTAAHRSRASISRRRRGPEIRASLYCRRDLHTSP